MPEKKQRKAKKPDLKVKKHTVKDLDPEKASQQIKGGQRCIPTVCLNSGCNEYYTG
jgi:hypothetical protein